MYIIRGNFFIIMQHALYSQFTTIYVNQNIGQLNYCRTTHNWSGQDSLSRLIPSFHVKFYFRRLVEQSMFELMHVDKRRKTASWDWLIKPMTS